MKISKWALFAMTLVTALTLGTFAPTRAAGQDVPSYTPFTVAPQLLNPQEVREATARAYPAVLRDAGIGGRATVWIHLDDQGGMLTTRINESSGNEALDAAALEVAEVFSFSPALNGDERVPVWISLPITFRAR